MFLTLCFLAIGEAFDKKNPQEYVGANTDRKICFVLTIAISCVFAAVPLLVVPMCIGKGKITLEKTIWAFFVFGFSSLLVMAAAWAPFLFVSERRGCNNSVRTYHRYGNRYVREMRKDRMFAHWAAIARLVVEATYLLSFWISYIAISR